jgi:hypothetical protein
MLLIHIKLKSQFTKLQHSMPPKDRNCSDVINISRRLWLNDGSCVRLRPKRPHHVWSYDFVQDQAHDACVFRALKIVVDELTRGSDSQRQVGALVVDIDQYAWGLRC